MRIALGFVVAIAVAVALHSKLNADDIDILHARVLSLEADAAFLRGKLDPAP